MYVVFADLLDADYAGAKALVDGPLRTAHLREERFNRVVDGVPTKIFRVYLTSTEDYDKLTERFRDTFAKPPPPTADGSGSGSVG